MSPTVVECEAPGQAFALPLVAPDCPFSLYVYVSSRCGVWVSGGAPETDAQKAVRRQLEGEDYYPRFAIQIEIPEHQYYDCWDASDDWSEVLTWVSNAHSIGEESSRGPRGRYGCSKPLAEG